MNYKVSFYILLACFIVGGLLLLKNGPLAFFIALAGVLQAAVFYKCPYCGQRLKSKPHNCPNCKKQIW